MSDDEHMGALAWLKVFALLFLIPAILIIVGLLKYTPSAAALVFFVVGILALPLILLYWAFLSPHENRSLINWARALIASTVLFFFISLFLFSTGGSMLRKVADLIAPPAEEIIAKKSALRSDLGDPSLNLGFRNLSSKDGRKIRAHVIFIGESQVEFIREDGDRFMMALADLSPEDQADLSSLRSKHQLGLK